MKKASHNLFHRISPMLTKNKVKKAKLKQSIKKKLSNSVLKKYLPINFDIASTAPINHSVGNAMKDIISLYEKGLLGNSNSIHHIGSYTRDIINRSIQKIARICGCLDVCVTVIPSASIANIFALDNAIADAKKKLTSSMVYIHPLSHTSVHTRALFWEKMGVTVITSLEKDIPEKSLVWATVPYVASTTGEVLSVRDLFFSIKKKYSECVTHVDATQAVGIFPISLVGFNAESMTVGLEKCGGPQGASVYVTSTYKRAREGTQSTLLYVAAEKTLTESSKKLQTQATKLFEYKKTFAEKLKKHFPHALYVLENSIVLYENIREKHLKKTSPHILAVSFPGVSHTYLAVCLSERYGICVGTGSACLSKTNTQKEKNDYEIIRLSFTTSHSKKDIGRCIEALRMCVPLARKK
ncbi:MAG: aminotransferase class V-fold PLP-dependent enzyme [Alphaproteobacteria bacterium]|nr:aminotransferase class V-fold PLP-dependent enzyme [Alphaproteobacteria bacterium]